MVLFLLLDELDLYRITSSLDCNMSAMIGEFSESHLLNVAKGVVEKKTADSVLLDANAEARIPKFKLKGIALNRISLCLPICVNFLLVLTNNSFF